MFGLSAPDPYIVVEDGIAPGYHDSNAKTLFTGDLSGAGIIIVAGQSLPCNTAPTPFTPVNSTCYNLNIYDGAVYKATDPLLGCSSNALPCANTLTQLADKLVTAGLSKVIMVPVGIGGTQISQWTSSANFGNRITVALRRLAARGLTPSAIMWAQGESDHGTAQATYQANLATIIGNSRTNGYNGPWFIAKETWFSGAVDSNVQAAQVAIVNHGSGIWAGPNADSLDATNRQGDNTHLNDTGSAAYAALWQTALHAFGAPF